MPRFHFGKTDGLASSETTGLANYFAAHDGAEFPYQPIPEREQSYLAEMEKQHHDYLGAGWQLMTKGACVQCHAIGQYKPTGGDQVVNGPDLRQVAARFRPGYLSEWLANPRRLVPYTAMPQNVPPARPAPAGRPQGVRGQAAGDGQGDARHPAQLRQRRRAATRLGRIEGDPGEVVAGFLFGLR